MDAKGNHCKTIHPRMNIESSKLNAACVNKMSPNDMTNVEFHL